MTEPQDEAPAAESAGGVQPYPVPMEYWFDRATTQDGHQLIGIRFHSPTGVFVAYFEPSAAMVFFTKGREVAAAAAIQVAPSMPIADIARMDADLRRGNGSRGR